MNTPSCIPIEELARVRELPAEAPERVHLAECPRCRARALALAEFERAARPLPDEADAGAAGRRLDAFIDDLARGPARTAHGPGRGSWLRSLLAPALRPALAAVLVAVAVGAAWFALRGPAPREVRGDAATTIALAQPVATSEGWTLAWTPVAGADEYVVLFIGADMRERSRVAELRVPELRLRRDAVPAGVTPGGTQFWQVVAYRAGDPASSSHTEALRLP